MKKIAFITPSDAKYGFNLAGVPQYTVEMPEFEVTLKKVMDDPDNGLVIIDERLVGAGRDALGVSEERMRELEQAWHGILLVLPSPVKPPAEAEDYATRLIRRAIGYHVRLKL
jgi:vacuolar-type H+-ATPase subunit F/Vma7